MPELWWLVIAATLAAGFAAVLFGFVPPPHARTLIWIRDGQLRVTRGQLRAQSREFMSDILQQAAVTSGYIGITSNKRVAFSRKIPRSVHQRLRNVLLNS